MLKRWGIRDRMLLLAVLPPALLAVIVGLYLVSTRIQDLERAHSTVGRAIASQLAPAARYALTHHDQAMLEHLVQAALSDGDVDRVIVTGPAGTVLAHAERASRTAVPASWLLRHLSPGTGSRDLQSFRVPISVPGPQAESGPARGWVDIQLSRAETSNRQVQVLVNGLLITLIGLLVSFLLALQASRDVTRPILRLTDGVRALRRGELNRRVPEESGGELGTLERGINAMAASLQAGRHDLQQQIDQATRELRSTLEELEVKNVELDLARRRAEEASRVKSGFLANMSHEIRTPVNGIMGFTHLLAQTRMDREQDEYVQIIHKSSANLLSIINDILDFSRVEAGKLVLENVPFDLRELVEDTVGLLAPLAYEKQLELVHLIYSDVPVRVRGDPVRLRQVLTNLLSNAIKFTPRGNVTVRVMNEAETRDNVTLTLSVADTGIGIDPREQERIFQAFTQADSSSTRRFGGTGLGLFVSEKLLQAMGGRIGFRSRLNRGSKFWFTVTLERCEESAATPVEVPADLQGYRVLLFETYHLASLAIAHGLEDWGMGVDEVDTLEMLESSLARGDATANPYDFVVLGLAQHALGEPAMQRTLHRLRATGRRTVVLVNSVDRSLHRRARELGADICLPKVIHHSRLYEQMARLAYRAGLTEPLPDPDPDRPTPVELPRDSLAGLRLLAADDNRINLRLLVTQLRRYGAAVVEAEDGEAALECFRKHPFDAVLLDVHMPVLSGAEVARRIREIEAGQHHTPVIAVTANAIPDEQRRFLEAGMDACLVKPIREQTLVATIQRNLARRAPAPQAATPTPAAPGTAEPSPPACHAADTGGTGVGKGADSAGQDPEVLEMLLEDLPRQRQAMNQAFTGQDRETLSAQVHLIHGSAAFCRLGSIRENAHALEAHLRQQHSLEDGRTGYLLARLNHEIEVFLSRHDHPAAASSSP